MSGAAEITGLIEALEQRVAFPGDPAERLEALIFGLSAAVKATSNDQNVQRLSRELRAAVPRLVAALTKAD